MNLENQKEIFSKLYNYFDLNFGDLKVFDLLISELLKLSEEYDWDKVYSYFINDTDPLFLTNRNLLVFHYSTLIKDNPNFFTWLELWSDYTSKLLLRVLENTKEFDYIVQQILNYEDFLFYEMPKNKLRKEIACKIYELRGLDFFLIYHFGKTTKAFEDEALFRSAELLPKFLTELNRKEEAKFLENELKIRKEKLKDITAEYSPLNNSISETLENIKLIGERFWVDYLTIDVWNNISEESRNDLIDSFVVEVLLDKGMLNGWHQAILSLCKVLERELGKLFFNNWIELIKNAEFSIPSNREFSSSEIEKRKYTFDVLKSSAKNVNHPPTLGQLLFVIKYWQDDLMNQCTNLFELMELRIRKKSEFLNELSKLNKWLNQRNKINSEAPSLIDLRNSSAHPGHENKYSWTRHLNWVKEILGKPPTEALKIIVKLKYLLNNFA